MRCLICAGSAEQIQLSGDFAERICADCGHYRISKSLILRLIEQGQIFDVARMRDWLAERRQLVDVPSINTHQAILVRSSP